MDSRAARAAIRAGSYRRHTAGLAAGRLQANLVILDEAHALDFLRFCARNPKPCPLVGVTDTGSPAIPSLAADIDLRRDLPSYAVYREGRAGAARTDITDLWTDRSVGFALGCSFTFEAALMAAGIPMPHVEADTTVPMFRTTIPLRPAGPFTGRMVVSYRPIPHERVAEAVAISARFPHAHGAPVHVGDPAVIGIADLARPDWGDAVACPGTHLPCFWACGVTPQAVVIDAALPLVITHTPGHMLLTDIAEDADTPVLLLPDDPSHPHQRT